MEISERRAAGLGATGALVAASLAVGLAEATLDVWVGWGRQGVAEGLGVLAGTAAAAASAWIAVVLGHATLVILRGDGPAREVPGRPYGRSVPQHARVRSAATWGGAPGRSATTSRVVAGLLVLGSLGVTPVAAGAAQPAPVCSVLAPVGSPGLAAVPDAAETVDPLAPGTSPLPEPGWTPTVARPAPRPSGDVGLVTTATGEPVHTVVVHRGDTLWAIAARHLGDRATDQDVAEAWPRWYAANRAVIGDDPDLILPGQQLTAPTTAGR
jgi:hypothetical protein